VRQTGSDPVDLVRGNACADSTPANEHAAIHFSGHKGGGDLVGVIGIVDRLGRTRAMVTDVMPLRRQERGEVLLQREARVIGGQGDPHRYAHRSASRLQRAFDSA